MGSGRNQGRRAGEGGADRPERPLIAQMFGTPRNYVRSATPRAGAGGDIAFQRLRSLVRAGYVPRADAAGSWIRMEHHGRGPALRLHSDGMIEFLDRALPFSAEGDGEAFRIAPSDASGFARLTRQVEARRDRADQAPARPARLIAFAGSLFVLSVCLFALPGSWT